MESEISNETINERNQEEETEETLQTEDGIVKKKKEKTPGVIYLSNIPKKMNVKLIREYFTNFGEVGRIYLEPEGYLNKLYVSLRLINILTWNKFK